MDKPARTAYRDDLRNARARAVSDAEGFQEVLFAIERLGTAALGEARTLGRYRKCLREIAEISPLALAIPNEFRYIYTPFSTLYRMVSEARNDAMHQGAYARHLTSHAIELCLVLEDSLMCDCDTVGDFMVKTVVQAELWQPLAYLRQQMLANSFSFLPFKAKSGEWKLVSDHSLAVTLRNGITNEERAIRLGMTLGKAIEGEKNVIEPLKATVKNSKDDIPSVLKAMSEASISNVPILITDADDSKILLGIVTAFDLM